MTTNGGQALKSGRGQRPKSSGFISSLRLMSAADFDVWNLIKRNDITNSYNMTLRYRTNKGVTAKRPSTSGGTIQRRRKASNDVPATTDGDQIDAPPATIEEVISRETEQLFAEEFDFDGEEPQEPPQYPHLVHKPGTHAQELYLKACREYGVPRSHRFYRSLTGDRVVMKRQRLGPLGLKACAVALVDTFAIHTIDLTDNGLGPKGAAYIAEVLRENIFIKCLILADNALGGEGVESLAKVITKLDNLTSLDLSGNGLGDKEAEQVRPLIEETTKLTELNLSHNEFREAGGKIIGDALFWNDTITSLDLSWNHLRRKGALKIAESLQKNAGLTHLDLSWNGLHLAGCRALGKALEKNVTLTDLDLSSNRVDKECLDTMLKSLRKNIKLKTLKLGSNPLRPEDALVLLIFLQQFPTSGLTNIDLRDQLVDEPFLRMLSELKEGRDLDVTYGRVRGATMDCMDETEGSLMDEGPVVVFTEFGSIVHVDVMAILREIDYTDDCAINQEKIQYGLKELYLPLSDRCLELMVKRLDISQLMPDKDSNKSEPEAGSFITQTVKSRHLSSASDTVNVHVRQKLQSAMTRKMSGNSRYRVGLEAMRTRARREGSDGVSHDILDRLRDHFFVEEAPPEVEEDEAGSEEDFEKLLTSNI